MYIKTRVIVAVYRLSVGALSTFASWLLFYIFGNEAWRLFPTWVALIAAIYYIGLTFMVTFNRRRDPGRIICPTLQGTLIVSGFTLAIFRLVFSNNGLNIAGFSGAGMILVDAILPVMFLLDWILFTKKGQWRITDPFYWLALPTFYASWILLSAEFMNTDDIWRYPYAVLDFYNTGIDTMLIWFVLTAVIILALGYVCLIIDFAMSGKLAKQIVLPHIKTVIVEEEVEDPITSVDPATSTSKRLPSEKTNTPIAIQKNKNAPQKTAKITKNGSKLQPDKTSAKLPTKTVAKVPARSTRKVSAKPKTSKKQPLALLEAEAKSVKSKTSEKAKASQEDKNKK